MMKYNYITNVFEAKKLSLIILKGVFKKFKKLHKPAPIN